MSTLAQQHVSKGRPQQTCHSSIQARKAKYMWMQWCDRLHMLWHTQLPKLLELVAWTSGLESVCACHHVSAAVAVQMTICHLKISGNREAVNNSVSLESALEDYTHDSEEDAMLCTECDTGTIHHHKVWLPCETTWHAVSHPIQHLCDVAEWNVLEPCEPWA